MGEKFRALFGNIIRNYKLLVKSACNGCDYEPRGSSKNMGNHMCVRENHRILCNLLLL